MSTPVRRIRVVVVTPFPAQQFVHRDVAALSRWYDVWLVEGLWRWGLVRCALLIPHSDFVLCWFGCRTAAAAVYLARVCGKPVAVIAGGQDVADLPEIGYGLIKSRRHRRFIRYAFRACNVALPVSECTAAELLKRVQPKAMVVIHNGVDLPRALGPKQSNAVLCVARVTAATLEVKGIRTLLAAANELRELSFTIVGEVTQDALRRLGPSLPGNVAFTGWLPHESVLALCDRARVYVQPSYYESFGVSVAEAMARGCIPVVTDRGALPEVVGDAGFYFRYGDHRGLCRSIERAMREGVGAVAADRIREHFPIERRAERLHKLIESLVRDGSRREDKLARPDALQPTGNSHPGDGG